MFNPILYCLQWDVKLPFALTFVNELACTIAESAIFSLQRDAAENVEGQTDRASIGKLHIFF